MYVCINKCNPWRTDRRVGAKHELYSREPRAWLASIYLFQRVDKRWRARLLSSRPSSHAHVARVAAATVGFHLKIVSGITSRSSSSFRASRANERNNRSRAVRAGKIISIGSIARTGSARANDGGKR